MKTNKREYGQYFTMTNPFDIDVFYDWMELFIDDNTEILEPFAGSCNICDMIKDIGYNNNWVCYDIDPVSNDYNVEQRDTIANFPEGFTAAITNPPYLYKSSAKRRGIAFTNDKYDDLYKVSLDVMLNNLDYVAAIIPESFITSGLFHNRLYAVISLTCRMFSDTECPVCLALFVPEEQDDFMVYRQNEFIGNYELIKDKLPISNSSVKWIMNDSNGSIGIRCIDNTKEASIAFIRGDTIDSDKIKSTSRSLTRVGGLPQNINLDDFIETCNEILEQYRHDTYDIFLTAFKGLREDGMYRRRLDYKTAKTIMNMAVTILTK